jgi:hypothetical protein
MTITQQVNSKKAAKAIVNKVYEADKNGGMFTNKTSFGFTGSVLTAFAQKNETGYVVEVSSSYYTENSINEIINNPQGEKQ